MKNKILLVDDEKLFLKSLKKGLEKLSGQFQTEISFSVPEAIKKIEKSDFDLIITDIRMPKKSGVDLLLYLKKINYKGSIKVMSAHNDAENLKKINALGIVNVISKPFDLEWFQEMIIDFFNEKSDASATFESIDLVSVMQIINIDKKNSVLQVDLEGRKGFIYFKDGEILDAEYEELKGFDALVKLISLKRGFISVKKSKNKVNKNINIPFIELIMDIMKRIDELRNEDNGGQKASSKNNTKEVAMAIKEVLKVLEDVNGYLGSGVFTPQGEMLEGSTEVSGISFEQSGSLIHDMLNNAKGLINEAGFGNMHMLQIYTDMGIVFAVCHVNGDLHFHTILVLNNTGNVAMGKIKLEKVVQALKTVL